MATKTMFVKAKSKYLADMISLRNPASARGSVRELTLVFNAAETKPKRLRIARAAQLAANRALATTKRKNLSRKERAEFWEIRVIYTNAAHRFFKAYGMS